MTRLLAALCLATVVTAQQPQGAPPAAPPPPSAGPLAVDDVALLLKQFNVPGVSIAVVNDVAIEWARGYGIADVESGALVAADTMFQAASISKPVAAMASMRAVENGRFTLDQDVNTILKTWKLPGDGHTSARPVTPRSLMSHTSGTGDGFGFPGYAPGAPLPTTIQIRDDPGARVVGCRGPAR